MLGRIIYSEKRSVALCREELSGAPFATVRVPALRTAPRHIRKAARLFRRCGVHRILVPAGFPYWPVLCACGMVPVDMIPFLQAIAPTLALAALWRAGEAPGRATVMLAGARASRPLCEAAAALCPVLRQLVIFAPLGGRELAEFLHREYGLPLLERCADSQLVIAFSETELPAHAPVLRLYEPVDLLCLCVGAKTVTVPQGSEPLLFLAALWELGRIDTGDVMVFPGQDT